MAVKYECPKCGRRFTEWGAEKLGFKCPQDQFCPPDADGETELQRVGPATDGPTTPKASLKRKPKKQQDAPPKETADTDELMAPDLENLDDEDASETDGDDDETEDDEEEVVEPAKLKLGDDEDDAGTDGSVLPESVSGDSVFESDEESIDELDE